MASEAQKVIDGVWRVEGARIIAGLVRLTRDVGLAEEAAQEAVVAALEQWAGEGGGGVPENPGAWLMATARRRAIDGVRRARLERRVTEGIAAEGASAGGEAPSDIDARLDGSPEDDVLRLIFMACYPALSEEARAAMALRLVCSLTVEEIARAYLVPEATISQRIVRAKRALAENAVEFEVPAGEDLPARLESVLQVVYLVFNEGYAATSGAAWIRPTLCEEAIRLGRLIAGLMPREGEVWGLVALMELQASRFRARVDETGRPVLLLDQDRGKWDWLMIRRGLTALEKSKKRGPGVYALQAEIAACHARARTADQTDWKEIVRLYTRLYGLVPSPVVALNLGVAVGMAEGPEAGLRQVDAIASHPAMQDYHLLPSVRGEFLSRLGRMEEAKKEFERAAGLAGNERERELLMEKARRCE